MTNLEGEDALVVGPDVADGGVDRLNVGRPY